MINNNNNRQTRTRLQPLESSAPMDLRVIGNKWATRNPLRHHPSLQGVGGGEIEIYCLEGVPRIHCSLATKSVDFCLYNSVHQATSIFSSLGYVSFQYLSKSKWFIKHYAMKTYRAVDVKLHLSWPRHCMEVSGQLQAPAALSPVKVCPAPAG
jgi:hypothetical protein